MSLTPEEMQARAAHAREIYASVDRERLVRHIVHLFDLEAAEEPDEFTYPAFTKPRRQRIFEIEFLDQPVEAGEGTVEHLDLVADFVIDADFLLSLIHI